MGDEQDDWMREYFMGFDPALPGSDKSVRVRGPILSAADTVSEPSGGVRCVWEVRGGVVPGHSMPEFTRRWILTAGTWHKEKEMSEEEFRESFPDGRSTFARYRDEAYEYAKSLMDPRALNWARVDWTWM
jgi:hypothetical protein